MMLGDLMQRSRELKPYYLLKEVDTSLSSVQAFELIKARPHSFFLDSGMDRKKLGRFSFIGSDPFLILRSRGLDIEITRDGKAEHLQGNPFDVLGDLLARYRLDVQGQAVPFLGGAVGYLSYDLCHFIERLPSKSVDDLQLPECYMAFYDSTIAFDHLTGKTYIVATTFPEMRELKMRARVSSRLAALETLLTTPPETIKAGTQTDGRNGRQLQLKGNFTHDDYVKAAQRGREYIIAGDIFEVNLSQRFETEISVTPWELYLRLRTINPAPFAAYLNFDGVAVVSASPERFIRLQGKQVETRPIKGTRPRGKTPEADAALAKQLVDSIKDQAEHVMIVDLERNDIGRVCTYGTVKVRELMTLEKYATVFHLTSTVEGKLREDKGPIDLLKATFPGGSITGAPKVRSMEIIDELEPTRRSVYTGSIGYISFNGDLDLNIAIRTLLVKGNRAYFQVGGAVVYDSDPDAEYIETLDKAKALIEALSSCPFWRNCDPGH